MATFADLVAVRYRKRKIPMDDVVTLCEGLRRAAAAVVEPGLRRRPSTPPSTRRSRSSSGTAASPATRASATRCWRSSTRAPDVTIKWVVTDPLVMNGEPFCYGTRLTVRNILELRSAGYTLTRMLKDHPELRRMGVAAAYEYAGRNRDRYAEFFESDGSHRGPGLLRGRGRRPPEPVPDPGRGDQVRLDLRA